MDKEKVIEYVMNSPQNTNRAVLSTLLDEGGGGSITMNTLFDSDISLVYKKQERMNTYAYYYMTESPVLSPSEEEYIAAYLDDIEIRGLVTTNYNMNLEIGATKNKIKLFSSEDLYDIAMNDANGFNLTIYSPSSDDYPELQAYYQEPHHLKIEWFKI